MPHEKGMIRHGLSGLHLETCNRSFATAYYEPRSGGAAKLRARALGGGGECWHKKAL
jgi:hypothetical protein